VLGRGCLRERESVGEMCVCWCDTQNESKGCIRGVYMGSRVADLGAHLS
jgi:hypothetical protein